jgi:DNA-binding NarL/FixJ family response regulator
LRDSHWSSDRSPGSVQGIATPACSEAVRPHRIRVALADDSYLMREAVHQVVEHHGDVEIVADCEDGATLLAEVRRTHPDVVVTDVRMPPSGDDEGIRVAQQLRESDPEIGVVVLSHYADPSYGIALFANGAQGRAYLLKDRLHDSRELQAAIEVVARGGSMIDPEMVRLLLETEERQQGSPLNALTPREREVLAAMAAGKSNAAIAAELVLTKRAVEKHVGSIFLKLGLPGEDVVSRRVAAVLLYLSVERA